MKYFLDTEFLEGNQTKRLFGIPLNTVIPNCYTKPTIDLISIGIKAEDGREYYAISKEFNLKEAWNRFDIKKDFGKPQNLGDIKVYWIRENVLKPIYDDLERKEVNNYKGFVDPYYELELDFTYKNFKRLINKYGKTNKQIAKEIKHFVANRPINSNKEQWILDYDTKDVQFYGYYADYDWVVFCWLFGKMIDLPKGFPMFAFDLKQLLDEKAYLLLEKEKQYIDPLTLDSGLDIIKHMPNYPKQTNEHNALADARWNYELYKFIQKL